MKKYKIQDREAGNVIESNLTLQEAQEQVKIYEQMDIDDDTYVADFYEIVEQD